MNKYNLIDKFFIDQSDYINFLVTLKERVIANDDGNCFASLKKEDGHFIYILTWQKDGKFLGDYIKPFTGTEENISIFNSLPSVTSRNITSEVGSSMSPLLTLDLYISTPLRRAIKNASRRNDAFVRSCTIDNPKLISNFSVKLR